MEWVFIAQNIDGCCPDISLLIKVCTIMKFVFHIQKKSFQFKF